MLLTTKFMHVFCYPVHFQHYTERCSTGRDVASPLGPPARALHSNRSATCIPFHAFQPPSNEHSIPSIPLLRNQQILHLVRSLLGCCIFHLACAYAPCVTSLPSRCLPLFPIPYARPPSPPTFPQPWRHPCPPHPQPAPYPNPPPRLLLSWLVSACLPSGVRSGCADDHLGES